MNASTAALSREFIQSPRAAIFHFDFRLAIYKNGESERLEKIYENLY